MMVMRSRELSLRCSALRRAHCSKFWWWAAALCALLWRASAQTAPAAGAGQGEAEALVTSALLGEDEAAGGAAAGAALRELAALVMAARGVRARAVPPPLPACRAPAAPACRDAVLRALAAGALAAALLPAPAAAAPAGYALRDAGLDVLGDAAPPARRVCRARAGAARSLLDLADPATAALYHLSPTELASSVTDGSTNETFDWTTYPNGTVSPDICDKSECATLLTSTSSEARELAREAAAHGLRARAVPLGARRPAAAALRRAVVCAPLPAPAGARALGPPPCAGPEPCAFEPYRLLKLVNVRALARTPSVIRALARLHLTGAQMEELRAGARASGAAAAARAFLGAHPAAGGAAEVRVSVLLPSDTRREGVDARALAAAAALAEEDEAAAPRAARFKVEVYDDGCSATRAYKHLLDALGTGEYGALSAVAGPACGAAFADVARQSPAHALPVLAYTPQAPPADARYVLLAAGDARDAAAALGALLAAQRWRRLAALTEPGTRALLDAARLRADVLVHTELADDGPDPDYELITEWAQRVAAARARVLLVWLEDARALRAALCAGRAAGLTPRAGAVWLLPPLAAGALAPARGERCSRAQLEDTAALHLTAAPAWREAWRAAAAPPGWLARWRRQCERAGARGPCREPPAAAALLYDALRLWAAALARLLARQPAAVDDLHRPKLVQTLIEDAVTTNYTGLTGRFAWSNGSRVAPLLLLQWDNGTRRAVGRWAAGELRLQAAALRWATPGGAAPDDGAADCALRPLADALGADCGVALGALLALLLAALAAALGGAGWLVKRRLERRYRARLAALGLATLAPELDALDRWELPRERVVINRKLGVGAFGTVYGGHALLGERRAWTAVAVKTLKPGAGMAEKLDFLAEAEAMKRLEHPNVVRLLGVVTHSEPACTVMEFMLYGDLKGYLLARRHLVDGDEGAGADEVSPRRLTAMALDAARALSYLAQLRFVHRDVAARNCLVSARRGLKLADFGMARPVCESDYYRFSRKGLLPVRWMAPESLARGVFSPASDVWSLGVLLYEIVTFGALPFRGLGNAQVLARVAAGRALSPPPLLNPSLEGLMKSCWQTEPRARPSAAAVAAFLADAPRLLTPCLVPLHARAPGELLGEPLGEPLGPPLPEPESAAPYLTERLARRGSWAAPSAATDTTDLSADADEPEARRFLP